jgi:hypothetical protein
MELVFIICLTLGVVQGIMKLRGCKQPERVDDALYQIGWTSALRRLIG